MYDYRDILRNELLQRYQRNPKYSLRAFARDLKLQPARLSEILNGKKGLSRVSAIAIAQKLGYDPNNTEIFCCSVEIHHARSGTLRKQAERKLKTHFAPLAQKTLSADSFRIVSEWYHFAILQAMKLDTYTGKHLWIAHTIGISARTVFEALSRLQRAGLIYEKEGRFIPSDTYVTSPDGTPLEAIRKFHQQVLEKASEALDTQSVNERDFTALFLPTSARGIEIARLKIRKFRTELMRELDLDETADRIYSLSIQFFKLGQSGGNSP